MLLSEPYPLSGPGYASEPRYPSAPALQKRAIILESTRLNERATEPERTKRN